MAEQVLTPRQVQLAWQAIATYAQEIHDRADTEDGWRILRGSTLAGDDKASSPVQVSHLVQSFMVSSSDHLHALCTLLFDAEVVHPWATGTILRSSIELAASALWVLQPSDRKQRVERSLRLRLADERDREKAMKSLGVTDHGRARRLAHIDRVRSRLGLAAVRPPTATRILQDISAEIGAGASSPFAMWQLASGFAHGRQWASLGLLEHEERKTSEPGIVNVRFSMSLDRLLLLAWVARDVLERAVDLYETRGAKPVPPAARRKRKG